MNLPLPRFSFIIVAFGGMLACSHAETRTFIDQSGRALEGELVNVNGSMVTIKRTSDGKMFTVAVSTFSQADQAYIGTKGGTASAAAATPGSPAAPDSSAKGESRFSVDLLSPKKGGDYLWIDGVWKYGAECIQTKVSTTADMPRSEAMLKAYFFSADGALAATLNRPSDQSSSDVRPITQFQKGKKYEVFFGIPELVQSGPKKWKRVIVVFGNGSDFAAKIYPKDDLTKFDFPEKPAVSGAGLTQ